MRQWDPTMECIVFRSGGLKEYIPAVFVGDSLVIRAIRNPWMTPTGHPFDGNEFLVYIWAID